MLLSFLHFALVALSWVNIIKSITKDEVCSNTEGEDDEEDGA